MTHNIAIATETIVHSSWILPEICRNHSAFKLNPQRFDLQEKGFLPLLLSVLAWSSKVKIYREASKSIGNRFSGGCGSCERDILWFVCASIVLVMILVQPFSLAGAEYGKRQSWQTQTLVLQWYLKQAIHQIVSGRDRKKYRNEFVQAALGYLCVFAMRNHIKVNGTL